MDGEVTPDQRVIGSSGEVVEETISIKELMTVRTQKGAAEVSVPVERCRQATWTTVRYLFYRHRR